MTYIENAFDTYRFMSEKNILIAFTGHLNHQVITSLLKNIKSKLSVLQVNPAVNKKVYSVLVESMENVSRHSSQENRAILLLSKTDTSYTIVAGNPIENKKVPELREKLEKFSKLDNEELKKIYREQLLSPQSSNNSAGLGMLDMAIKSDNNVEYNFQPISALMSFYLLQIKINF